MAESEANDAKKKHLFILVHGLWGNHSHMDSINEMMSKTLDNFDDIVCFKPKNSGHMNSLHGLTVVSYNVLEEINSFVVEYGVEKFDRVSLIGYSMGGLVARFVIGKMVTQCKEIFEHMQPTIFVTFATPHLGVNFYQPQDKTRRTVSKRVLSSVLSVLGKTILGRSGSDIFISNRKDRVLVDLSQGEYLYGLSKFEHRICIANVKNDRTVAFYTSCITNSDPFIETGNTLKYHFKHDLPIDVSEYPVQPRILDLDSLTPGEDRAEDKTQTASFKQKMSRVAFIFVLVGFILPVIFTVNVVGTCYSYVTTYRRHSLLRYGYRKAGSKVEAPGFESGAFATLMSWVRNLIGDTINDEHDSGKDEESDWSIENNKLHRTLTSDSAQTTDVWKQFIRSHSRVWKHSKFQTLPFDESRETIYENLSKLTWIRIPVYIKALNAHDGIVARKGLKKATPYGVANVKFACELINYLLQ
ncbi:unnamed protein product [Kluyveromyces dobzhanskii CBS 2104]|uniref:WGS project CCBQ000000000 data, contig 00107 n=1 Tax=Kluyveromyces dobzhanskii CBS 2104 TaxID=1427455 RepID=A0A0A8L0R3_9SACH|nr:unnamed protein product [Kluyveromyces dobzhanskii CBS 2104]